MNILKGVGDFFALDIGTNAIKVIQLSKSGKDSFNLKHFGYAPVDNKIVAADSRESQNKLSEVIMTAIGQSGIKTKSVVLGIPSQKSFTTVIDVPKMNDSELKGTIKYQIDKYIPMNPSEAKVDWVVLGQSLHDPNQLEVLLTSTANTYAEDRLEFIEQMGFDVIGIEPDPIAMIRALLPPGSNGTNLILDVGSQSSDIAITYNDTPRLVRTIPIGLDSFVKSAVQNLNIEEAQAKQFILKFGLDKSRLEGQVVNAIENTLDNYIGELEKSTKYFHNKYPEINVGGILVSGYGSSIPHFADYIGEKTKIPTNNASPWQKVNVQQEFQQQLSPVANEFAIAIGLAQRSNDR